MYDADILKWQVENSNLLKPMGIDLNQIKLVIFIIFREMKF
jgi:hypothetical protein